MHELVANPVVLLGIQALGGTYRCKVKPKLAFLEDGDQSLRLPCHERIDSGGAGVTRYLLPPSHQTHRCGVEAIDRIWRAHCLAIAPKEYMPNTVLYIGKHFTNPDGVKKKLHHVLFAGLESHLKHYPR